MSNNNGNNNGRNGGGMIPWRGPHGPGAAGPHGPNHLFYEENQFRTDRNIPPAYQNNKTIENLMGDGCLDARHYVCDKARPVPGIASNGPMLIRAVDYPTVGTIGQARSAAEAMFARGAHMPDQFVLTSLGAGTFEVSFNRDTNPSSSTPATPLFPISYGFVIDWGISMLNFQPFDLEIASTRWVGVDDRQVLDRRVRVRVERCCGSSIYIPWAMRISPAMAQAVNQLAVPEPQEQGADVSLIQVVNVPTAIEPAFSAVVSFMTAASPQIASYAALSAMYGNVGYQVTRPASPEELAREGYLVPGDPGTAGALPVSNNPQAGY
jgi:hypothetical protein